MPASHAAGTLAADAIATRIRVLRGQRVLLDAELAALYGVSTKRFNEQVRRNARRFPADFMFKLSSAEWKALRSQFATLEKASRGRHRKYLPLVFTEHGAIMAASILNSARAIEVSVYVVRAFVLLREAVSAHKELARRLDELESRIGKKLSSHDEAITGILSAIRGLMAKPEAKRRPIGFIASDNGGSSS